MLVLLSGVSGAGKDTVKQELIKRNKNVESLPSYTDRAPRNNDIPGVTYNFVTTQEFERMIEQGELYEYSKHHEHYYGTSKKLLNERIFSYHQYQCYIVITDDKNNKLFHQKLYD